MERKPNSRSRCELTKDPRKRAAANAQTAAIKDSLPAWLSQPALRALAGAGLVTLEHFTRVAETDVLKLHGMGPKAVMILRAALDERGLSFRG